MRGLARPAVAAVPPRTAWRPRRSVSPLTFLLSPLPPSLPFSPPPGLPRPLLVEPGTAGRPFALGTDSGFPIRQGPSGRLAARGPAGEALERCWTPAPDALSCTASGLGRTGALPRTSLQDPSQPGLGPCPSSEQSLGRWRRLGTRLLGTRARPRAPPPSSGPGLAWAGAEPRAAALCGLAQEDSWVQTCE